MAGYYDFMLAVSVSVHLSIFSFLDDNLSKYNQFVTRLGTAIDTLEIWFGIANGQILSIFDKVFCR